jgi:hypothetical protein
MHSTTPIQTHSTHPILWGDGKGVQRQLGVIRNDQRLQALRSGGNASVAALAAINGPRLRTTRLDHGGHGMGKDATRVDSDLAI